MARFNDENVPAAVRPHLQPGEQLLHWAYGVKQPNMGLLLLFGAIVAAIWTKHYVVALTDRRLLALRFTGKLNVQEVREWSLASLPPVTTSTGMLFTHIKVQDAEPFVVKCHRMGMPNNRTHAMAIAAALESRRAPAMAA
jgi:hypothetical protein